MNLISFQPHFFVTLTKEVEDNSNKKTIWTQTKENELKKWHKQEEKRDRQTERKGISGDIERKINQREIVINKKGSQWEWDTES